MEWRKSSRSNGNGGNNCVEVAESQQHGHFIVRNSKQPEYRVYFTRDEWAAFVEGVKAGEFDV